MAHDDDKEYASKGVAGTGLGLGIAGTALGLLNAGNNGNGILGNLFGGGNGGFGGGYAGNLGARAQVAFDFETERRVSRLEAENAALRVANVKDERIAQLEDQLVQSNLLRYIDDKMCGVIKGQPYLSPRQMADPYMGSRQVISTHAPVVDVERAPRRDDRDCGGDWDRWY